jgi:lipoyl(octanoyl) transferase
MFLRENELPCRNTTPEIANPWIAIKRRRTTRSEYPMPFAGMQWRFSHEPVEYPDSVAFMERRVELIREGRAPETIWLLEHPPLYTAGTSARDEDLLAADKLPVYRSGRGGQFTYHGPGQRVVYLMLDLDRRGRDIRAYVRGLESWVIAALAKLGVAAERREGCVGIWVVREDREEKIAAIGVRVRRWVTYHGVAINVDPDLGHYAGIVPCGIKDRGVTSLKALGVAAGMDDLDAALADTFADAFPDPR